MNLSGDHYVATYPGNPRLVGICSQANVDTVFSAILLILLNPILLVAAVPD
jgi:hypothetical protein